jgi:hypothetical protein
MAKVVKGPVRFRALKPRKRTFVHRARSDRIADRLIAAVGEGNPLVAPPELVGGLDSGA